MAFANYFIEGSYSIIDDVNISYKDYSLDFKIHIYKDSSKSELLATKPVSINGNNECVEIEYYITNLKQLPKNSETFLLSKTEKSGWYTRNVQIIDNEPFEQILLTNAPPEFIYVKDTDSYFNLKPDLTYEEGNGMGTIHFWEKYLSSSAMQDHKDLKAMLYDFLFKKFKMYQGFEGEV